MSEFPPENAVASEPPPEPAAERRAVPPEPPKRKGRGLFWGLLGGCLVLFVGFTVLSAVAAVMARGGEGFHFPTIGPKIAIVPIEGEILESRETVERLRRYWDDRSVRGLVVRINSPGGAIVPSQEIYAEILRLRREGGKPIIASLDSVAASGGYYIAAACDTIVANPGSITGSIGVITQWMNVQDLLAWARLKPQTITSGSMKDVGSPFREMTPDERAYIQRLVLELHGQFVGAVAEAREGKITEAELRGVADGRVFTGAEAKRLKLVDEIGTLQDAVLLAARRSGLDGEPETVWPREKDPSLIELLAGGESARALASRVLGSGWTGTHFLYRWY